MAPILVIIDSSQYDLSDLPEGVSGKIFRQQINAMFHHGSSEEIQRLIDYYQSLKNPPLPEGAKPEEAPPNAYAIYFSKVITSLQALKAIRDTEAAHAQELHSLLASHGKALADLQARHATEMTAVHHIALTNAGREGLQTSDTEPPPEGVEPAVEGEAPAIAISHVP